MRELTNTFSNIERIRKNDPNLGIFGKSETPFIL